MPTLLSYIEKRYANRILHFENQGNRVDYELKISREGDHLLVHIVIWDCTMQTIFTHTELQCIVNEDKAYFRNQWYCVLIELGHNIKTRFQSMFSITPVILFRESDVERYINELTLYM